MLEERERETAVLVIYYIRHPPFIEILRAREAYLFPQFRRLSSVRARVDAFLRSPKINEDRPSIGIEDTEI